MKLRFAPLFFAALLAAGCAGKGDTALVAEAETPVPTLVAPEAEPETTEPAPYANVVIAVRRNAETVSERAVTDPSELETAQEIVFDYLVKSAAWEGVEVSELENCIALSFDLADDGDRQQYYQYEADGRPVLQAGEAGMYCIMSDGAYEKLLRLAALPAGATISPAEAEALLRAHFGERDEATGNTFSFGYAEPLTVDGREYYRFRISWLVDNNHLSYLTDYLVSTDGGTLTAYEPVN